MRIGANGCGASRALRRGGGSGRRARSVGGGVRPAGMRLWTAAVAGLTVPAAGCSDGLAPSYVAGTYVLESIGGAPLPAPLYEDAHPTLVVLADTMRLESNFRGQQVVTANMVFPELTESVRWESTFSYEIKGLRVEISFVCPPNALCIPPPHRRGTRVSGGLRVEAIGGGPIHYYRRVMSP